MPNYQSSLINEIKKNPCLYIKDNPVFRDPTSQKEAWIKISKKLKLDVKFLQKEWRKLQECYKVIIIARRKHSRAAKLWKFEDQMKFMEYYLQPKKRSPPTDLLKEERMDVQTLEPKLMEISSSVITSNTSEPEIEKTSEQKSDIPSQSGTTPSTEKNVIDGDKASSPGHGPNNTNSFCNLPESCDTAPMETIPQTDDSQADEKPETSEMEDAPMAEPDEDELEIVYDGYQERNRISSSKSVGSLEGSEVSSKIESPPVPEISTEATESDVMIIFDGNPLDNRREKVDL